MRGTRALIFGLTAEDGLPSNQQRHYCDRAENRCQCDRIVISHIAATREAVHNCMQLFRTSKVAAQQLWQPLASCINQHSALLSSSPFQLSETAYFPRFKKQANTKMEHHRWLPSSIFLLLLPFSIRIRGGNGMSWTEWTH